MTLLSSAQLSSRPMDGRTRGVNLISGSGLEAQMSRNWLYQALVLASVMEIPR